MELVAHIARATIATCYHNGKKVDCATKTNRHGRPTTRPRPGTYQYTKARTSGLPLWALILIVCLVVAAFLSFCIGGIVYWRVQKRRRRKAHEQLQAQGFIGGSDPAWSSNMKVRVRS